MGHYAAEMLYPEYKSTEDELEKQRQARAERDARWQKQMNQWAKEWTTAPLDNHTAKNGKKTKKNKSKDKNYHARKTRTHHSPA